MTQWTTTQLAIGFLCWLLWCSGVPCSSALLYAPQFHIYSPGHRIGRPSAPLRHAQNGKIDIFAEFTSDPSETNSQGWIHFASTDYVTWYQDSSGNVLLPPTQWYNAAGSLGGSVSLDADDKPIIAYTCLAASGIPRLCMSTTLSLPSGAVYLEQNSLNPVLAAADTQPSLTVLGHNFRDPTGWWAAPETREEWRVGVAAEEEKTNAAIVAVFSTTDPQFQDKYTYSHVLYRDANFSMFGVPDYFPLRSNWFLKLTMLHACRDYVVYGTVKENEQFVEDQLRPPTFVDLGTLVDAKTFWDPITKTERLWGYVPEDWDNATAVREQGWAGAISSLRVLQYSVAERKLMSAPAPELKALRREKISSSITYTLTGTYTVVPVQVTTDPTPYHEVLVDFELPADWMVPNDDHPPELGLHIRGAEDGSTYTRVTLEMPTKASCKAAGGVGDGLRFRTIPLYGEFNSDDVQRCNTTCEVNTICDRWDAVLRPYGMDCVLYTLSSTRRSGEVCGTQSGCPLASPQLSLDRSLSGSGGNTSTLRGRASLSLQNSKKLQLHVLVDDSVVEVFKDGGMETLTGRIYVPPEQTRISVFARNVPDDAQVTARVSVYTMGSSMAPKNEALWGDSLRHKIRDFADNYSKVATTKVRLPSFSEINAS